jgi:hypothetical protein
VAALLQVWVAQGGALLGCLHFRDMLRPDAISAVAQLQQMGIAVHMLSGAGAAGCLVPCLPARPARLASFACLRYRTSRQGLPACLPA